MTATTGKKFDGFSAEEVAAMKDHAKELKKAATREAKSAAARAEGESDLLEKIAKMRGSDRVIAEKVHAIVKANAPDLMPRLWYGMPAYAKDGKVLCFFQPASKFKTRYATLGFNDVATLDDGNVWPTAYALIDLTPQTRSGSPDCSRRRSIRGPPPRTAAGDPQHQESTRVRARGAGSTGLADRLHLPARRNCTHGTAL